MNQFTVGQQDRSLEEGPEEVLITEPGQEWDSVAVIRYPTRRGFVEMVRSPEYRAIAHLRPETRVEMALQPMAPVIDPAAA